MRHFSGRIIPVLLLLLAGLSGAATESRQAAAQANGAQASSLVYLPAVARSASPAPKVTAFPGAEGFGAYTVGGRGGTVIEVTNLNDSGPGSLRACVEATMPRICVFRVGGIIDLATQLIISNPYITIAGQTAPGDGITIRTSEWLKIIRTHDVVIRHLRIRGTGLLENKDVVIIYKEAYNIIIDHCSTSWSTDEVLSISGGGTPTYNISIQWTIISEALNVYDHSSGSLIGNGAHYISLHHNLYAHNDFRNPNLTGDLVTLGDEVTYYDLVNNVIYNWYQLATATKGNAKVNIIGNYYKIGPNTLDYTDHREVVYYERLETHLVYMDGNIGPNCLAGCDPDKDWDHMIGSSGGDHECYWSGDECLSSEALAPFNLPPVTTSSAQEAYDDVLAGAGATLGLNGDGTFFWRRDAVDERVINDVINGTGAIIDLPADVGGFPTMDPGTPYPDADHDGMGDAWEALHGFNSSSYADNALDADGDGYTNLEEFLNGTDPRS